MDAVESEIFVLYMIAIAYQYLTAQFNRRGDDKLLVPLLFKNLVLWFPQAYAFGLQLPKSVGYGSFLEYFMWVCGDCSREFNDEA